jgi:alpha-tubulin suppressor-like RCC1 family protein
MTPEESSTPLPVDGLASGVRAVFGGAVAHCAVLEDGHVLCWGDSVFGEFEGRGAVHAIALSPFEAPGLSSVASLGIGTYFHCALNVEGDVKCYGLNGAGQLGSGTLDDGFVPAGVLGLGPSRGLAAAQSGFFACAVTIAGAVLCWGTNVYGQLGNGTKEDALAPVAVSGLESGIARVTAGRDHACAIANDATYCWGDGSEGQLGSASGGATTPVVVVGLPPLVAVAAGAAHTCGLAEAGSVHCWGSSASGHAPAPTEVIASGVVEIAAGGHHTCALLESGLLRCWGTNGSGQLGPFAGAGAPL